MIEWDDKYNVGISMIDEEHKKFIGILNKAIYVQQYDDSPKAISEILVEMNVYALKHFNTEETYMINFKYYDYKSHKDEHKYFSKMVFNYCKKLIDGEIKVIDEILEFLKQWLVNHIQVTDKKYVDCFNENGLK